MKRLGTALLCVVMLLSICLTPAAAAETATATTMRLEKVEGTVSLTNASGTAVTVKEGMRLYSGYQLRTEKGSYAYISLDGGKAVKLDASSAVSLSKAGRKLEVKLTAGKLFFDVTVPLKANETLNIRTSTMVTGVRGTAGWVELISRFESHLHLLEGRVTMHCADLASGTASSRIVQAGETARSAPTGLPQTPAGTPRQELSLLPLTEDRVPGFVWEELARDPELVQRILEDPAYEGEETTSIGLPPAKGEPPAPEAMEQLNRRAEEALQQEETAADQREQKLDQAAKKQTTEQAPPAFPPEPAPRPTGGGGGGSAPAPAPEPTPPPPPEQPELRTVDLPTASTTDLAAEIQTNLNDSTVGTVNVTLPPNGLTLNALQVPAQKTLTFRLPQGVSPEKGIPLTLTGNCGIDAGATVTLTGCTMILNDGVGSLAMNGSFNGNLMAEQGMLTGTGSFTAASGTALTVTGASLQLTGGSITAEAGLAVWAERAKDCLLQNVTINGNRGCIDANEAMSIQNCTMTLTNENPVDLCALKNGTAPWTGTIRAKGDSSLWSGYQWDGPNPTVQLTGPDGGWYTLTSDGTTRTSVDLTDPAPQEILDAVRAYETVNVSFAQTPAQPDGLGNQVNCAVQGLEVPEGKTLRLQSGAIFLQAPAGGIDLAPLGGKLIVDQGATVSTQMLAVAPTGSIDLQGTLFSENGLRLERATAPEEAPKAGLTVGSSGDIQLTSGDLNIETNRRFENRGNLTQATVFNQGWIENWGSLTCTENTVGTISTYTGGALNMQGVTVGQLGTLRVQQGNKQSVSAPGIQIDWLEDPTAPGWRINHSGTV